MMRDEIQYARYIIIGGVVLYLTGTISDGDASPLSPLQEQIWPSSPYYRRHTPTSRVRWYAAVIYRKSESNQI